MSGETSKPFQCTKALTTMSLKENTEVQNKRSEEHARKCLKKRAQVQNHGLQMPASEKMPKEQKRMSKQQRILKTRSEQKQRKKKVQERWSKDVLLLGPKNTKKDLRNKILKESFN